MARFQASMAFRSPVFIVVIVAVISGSAYAYWRLKPEPVSQPIAFNHRAHVANAQIQCSDCHVNFLHGARSGLPDAEACMTCHADGLTQKPEEAKLRDLVKRGESVVFRKLFHLPGHVYYSHRRHVVVGKLECARCHGNIAETETPPSRPLVNISMDFCVDCHKQAKVTNDCKTCHR